MASTSPTSSYSPSQFTQQTMLNDLMQQKGLLIGLGAAALGLIWLLARRTPAEEKAARRLVRDWRNVDDPDDARELLGSNVPTILRPALLLVLEQLERQVHQGFRRLERELRHL